MQVSTTTNPLKKSGSYIVKPEVCKAGRWLRDIHKNLTWIWREVELELKILIFLGRQLQDISKNEFEELRIWILILYILLLYKSIRRDEIVIWIIGNGLLGKKKRGKDILYTAFFSEIVKAESDLALESYSRVTSASILIPIPHMLFLFFTGTEMKSWQTQVGQSNCGDPLFQSSLHGRDFISIFVSNLRLWSKYTIPPQNVHFIGQWIAERLSLSRLFPPIWPSSST